MRTTSKDIKIYGAGLAGLIAANLLAERGYRVKVLEKRSSIGGPREWHPSIHLTYFNKEATWDYIGMNLDPCFKKIHSERRYIYDRVQHLNPENNYACERGSRKSSIDNFLYQKALKKNVQFLFGEDFKPLQTGIKENIIINCGLEKEAYQQLGIPVAQIQGYKSCIKTEMDCFAAGFFNRFTNFDFAYLGALNKILFILLFSRFSISKNELSLFQSFLKEKENIHISNWQYSEGCVPLETNLFKNGYILAGTMSGLIDPFFLNGISGALISGRIAAMAVEDREHAQKEFNRFIKNFYIKWKLKKMYQFLPLKPLTFRFFSAGNSLLKDVGFI
jgi:flavin-dependent dehydrogenase